MLQRHLSVSAAVAFAVAAILGGSAADAAGSVTQGPAPADRTLRCYPFSVTNHEKRKLTDIHITIHGATPSHTKAPPGWDATVNGNTLTFQTPEAHPAGHTVSPNPIGPGKPLGGFRFCLPRRVNADIALSYENGPMSHAVQVIREGVEIPTGGTIGRLSKLHCFTLNLTAPDAAVYDVHLGRSNASSSPGYDSITVPAGWHGGVTGPDGVDLLSASGPLIAPGQSVTIGVCTSGIADRITWKLTDKSHHDIPGASGTTKITY
jgi:hypothetical protein